MQQNSFYASGGDPSAQDNGSHHRGPSASAGVMGSVMGTFRQWSIAGGQAVGQTAGGQAGSDPRGFEEMETAHNLRFAQMAQEKDAMMEQLQYKLRLREDAILQLEQNIQMQQGATELIRKECEVVQEQLQQVQQQQLNPSSENNGVRRGSGSHAQMEEDEMKEIIQQLHNKLREKSDTNNALLRTTKTQRDQMSSLEKTVTQLRKEVSEAKEASEAAEAASARLNNGSSNGNEEMEEKLEEMKDVIQQLQAKLLDKNNTNAALVRSAKMQNDKAAAFRTEIQALQKTANDTREEYQVELERLEQELHAREDELVDLREQLSSQVGGAVGGGRRATSPSAGIETADEELSAASAGDGQSGSYEGNHNVVRSEEERSIASRSEASVSVGSRESGRNVYGGVSGHLRPASPTGGDSSSRCSERSMESDSRHQRGNQYSDDSSQDEFSSYNSEDEGPAAKGSGTRDNNRQTSTSPHTESNAPANHYR
jgi:hypothetical protein